VKFGGEKKLIHKGLVILLQLHCLQSQANGARRRRILRMLSSCSAAADLEDLVSAAEKETAAGSQI
jgi:hypothetical protein